MQKIRITAKPKDEGNHITVKLEQLPELTLEGTCLTGFSFPANASPAMEAARLMTVAIPAPVDAVEDFSFRGWEELHHVCFGKTAYRLGCSVFADCRSLKTVVLAEGTEKIPLDAFSGCSSLRQVTLPGTITRINMNGFKNCEALEALTLPPALEVIELSAFWGCRSLETLSLPDSLTELGDDAFGCCTGLKRVQLPASLKTMGTCVFQNCIRLEEIVIPPGVKKLHAGLFAGCKNLRRVVLPETLEFISPYAFYNCEKLEIVEHPDIGKFLHAFRGTPFLRRHIHRESDGKQLPMALLNMFAGGISGCMLSAMGYHWFDIDREYKFFLTDHPGVIEVHARYPDTGVMGGYGNDYLLMTESLERIPGIQPLIRFSDLDIIRAGDVWDFRKRMAQQAVERQRWSE